MRPTGPLSSLLESREFPLPLGPVLAGMPPIISIGTPAAEPADFVEVLVRHGGTIMRSIRAFPERGMREGGVQWFRAMLPELQPGDSQDYRIEWMRGGRRLAALPSQDGWYNMVGVADPPSSAASSDALKQIPVSALPAAAPVPRYGYELQFFAALTVNLRAEIMGEAPDGFRINVFVKDGRVIGPLIDATVEPGGGDYMLIRKNGIGEANIKCTYRTKDGAFILEEATGRLDLGPDGYAKMAARRFDGRPSVAVAPRWTTAHPEWAWLNRAQGFAVGRVVMDILQVQYDMYIPIVKEGPRA